MAPALDVNLSVLGRANTKIAAIGPVGAIQKIFDFSVKEASKIDFDRIL